MARKGGNPDLQNRDRQLRVGMGKLNTRKFAELGLPNVLARHGRTQPRSGLSMRGNQKLKKLAKELPAFEAALSAWEAANPERYRACPWFEAREAFKAQKALGLVVQPLWWELGGAVCESALGHSAFTELTKASTPASSKRAERTRGSSKRPKD